MKLEHELSDAKLTIKQYEIDTDSLKKDNEALIFAVEDKDGQIGALQAANRMQADELTGLKANLEMSTSSGQQLNEKIAKMIEQNTTYQAKNNALQEQIGKLEELLETSETNVPFDFYLTALLTYCLQNLDVPIFLRCAKSYHR